MQDGEITIDGTTTAGTTTKLTNGLVSINGSSIDNQWLSETTLVTNLNGKTISLGYVSGTAPGSSWAFRLFTDTSTHISQWRTGTSSTQYTWAEDTSAVSCLALYVNNGYTFDNYKVKIQIESGSSASPFEPYTGGIPAPSPDFPMPIQVVTGEQTVNISDGETSEDYTLDLGAIELCKIGTYQDYIYQSNGDWYVHKTLGKYTFDGSETITYNTSNKGFTITPANTATYLVGIADPPLIGLDTHFKVNNTTSTWVSDNTVGLNSGGTFWCKATGFANSKDDCTTWLTNNTPTIYYGLANATDTKITDATLISQLEALNSAELPAPIASITLGADGSNLTAILTIAYYGSEEE